MPTLRIAEQFGFASVPLMVMQQHHLLERQLRAQGLHTKVDWLRFSGGAAMNDALLSGSLNIATGGITPLLTIWDKSHGAVKGMASLGSIPLVLVTNDPAVKTLKDFGPRDKIAVPAVRVSIQAVFLQMAAAKVFGPKKYDCLDRYTVSMPHPDALVAMLSHTAITAHISSSPYVEQELASPGAHEVISSERLLGPTTNVALYTTTRFHHDHPRVYAAVMAALTKAMQMIHANKQVALQAYLAIEKSKVPKTLLERAFTDPANHFTETPQGFQLYADFMYDHGELGRRLASWKDAFFPGIRNRKGS